MTDINRRKLLQGIGTATGAGLTGLGLSTSAVAAGGGPDVTREEVSVSEADIESALNREASRIALKEASLESLNRDRAKAYAIKVEADGTRRRFHEVVAPAADGKATFSYVKSNDAHNVASIKTKTGTIVRTTARDDDIQTEILEHGEEVTNEALQTLEQSGKKAAIESTSVVALETDQASAALDKTTGTTHFFAAATTKTGEKALVYTEIPDSGNPDSVYVIQEQDSIGCVMNCVGARSASVGFICWVASCSPCVGGLAPACAACIACAGGIGASCAISCGAEELF